MPLKLLCATVCWPSVFLTFCSLAAEAAPLTARSLENLVAYSKLLGYVKYFHPSDESASLDWDQFAAQTIEQVESASTPSELAAALETIFQPVAPTLRVFPAKESTPSLDAWKRSIENSQLKTAWVHAGVSLSSNSRFYTSRRINLEAQETVGKLPEGSLDPVVRSLAGGVACLLPRALAVDAGRTTPKSSTPVELAASALSGDERSTRLAAVALAWNIFQHFYPYFDVVDADWEAALRRALSRAAADADETAFLWTLRRLVAELRDGHGGVRHASETVRKPPFFWNWIEGRLVITHVLPDFDVPLAPGDIVLELDGVPALDRIRAAEETVSAATDAHRRLRALRTMLSGPRDSEMSLRLQSANGPSRIVSVARIVHPRRYAEQPPVPKWREINPSLFYVALFRITQDEFDELLPRLTAADKLIFDVRGYPRVLPASIGHMITETVKSPQMYIPQTSSPNQDNVDFAFGSWEVEPSKPRLQGRIAFLTNERAISYAETYLSIIEHYRLGEIIGSPTAGTNGNVNPFTLPGGYRVFWTGMKVLKQDGAQHHGVGVEPTVLVRPTLASVRAGRDEVLARAIEILSR